MLFEIVFLCKFLTNVIYFCTSSIFKHCENAAKSVKTSRNAKGNKYLYVLVYFRLSSIFKHAQKSHIRCC